MKKRNNENGAVKKTLKRVSRRSFVAGAGGIGLVLASATAPAFIREAGASKMRDVSFMLPWLFVGGQAFEFVAQAGSWKARGLNVSIVRGYGSGAACKAISAGQAMFGEASYNVMAGTVSKGLDLVGIGAKLQRNPMAIACRADSGIRSPKDLQGHSLVQAASSGDTLMFPGFVKATGIDPAKIEITAVHPSKLISTVLNGQANCMGHYYVSGIAAASTMVPLVSFLYADYGLQTLDLGLITTSGMIKDEPKLVQDMVDGAMEGLKTQLLEPEKALDAMIAAKPELETGARAKLQTQVGNTNALSIAPAVEANGLGWMASEDQDRTRNVVIDYMGATNVPAVDKLFANQFAGNIKLTAAEWATAKELAAPYATKKA